MYSGAYIQGACVCIHVYTYVYACVSLAHAKGSQEPFCFLVNLHIGWEELTPPSSAWKRRKGEWKGQGESGKGGRRGGRE